MKTNILFRIVVLPAVLFALTACDESKFLDLVNPNNATEFQSWKTVDDVQAAMATVYSPLRSQMYGYFSAESGWQLQNGRADDTWSRNDNADMYSFATFTNTLGTDHNGTNFGRLYWCIHRANTLLANIEKVPMSESLMNELKAEATFLRGFSYFLLVINWGDVPVRIVPAENTDDVMCPSSPEADVWKQVEEDMKFAKEYLPLTRPGSEEGRVLKGAAVAYLGKSYVFQGKYEDAEKELGLLLQTPYTYDLMPNYEDNFTEFTEFNQESIFEFNYDEHGTGGMWGSEDANSMMGIALPNYIGTTGTGGWFKVMPTSYMADAFMIEERPAGSDTKFDKRMYTSLYFKYSDFNDVKQDELFYGNTFTFDELWTKTNGGSDFANPGFSVVNGVQGRFLLKKYTNWWLEGSTANDCEIAGNRSNNYRVMRFAEVLLLHAEACIQTGNLTQAASHLNRIRERAGLVQKSWAGKEELRKELEHQKFLELCQEGTRFFDLKRWYSASEVKQLYAQNNKQGAEFFEEKHFYLPIPTGEINTNTEIEQHPLWR